jgi:acyl-CoA synthetase (AMP-forming)/AMP-acid ligase II
VTACDPTSDLSTSNVSTSELSTVDESTAGTSTPTWSALYAKRADSDSVAVVGDGFTWTFRQLTAHGANAAAWLDSISAPTGQPFAAVVSSTSFAFALAIGAVGSHRPIAPIGARLTVAEVAATLSGLAPSIVVTEPEAEAVVRAAAEPLGLRVEVHPSIDELSAWALADTAASQYQLDFTADRNEYAALLHTSGTSGRPKPVPYPQGTLVDRTRVHGGLLGLGPGALYAFASPFHHIAGLGAMFVAFGSGAAVCPLKRFTVDSWADVIALGVTHAQLVPSMVEALLDRNMLVRGDLRVLQYGASRIDPGTLRRFLETVPGVDLVQMYGQTEGSPVTVLSAHDHHRAADGATHLLSSAGCAVDGVTMVIHEPDSDGIGEVWARGVHFMKPDGDGWLRTGDLGSIDSDGYLFLAGRKGDMIIRGGENVYPEEVETVLRTHPGVADVCVVGESDRRLGQIIVAHVVLADVANPPLPEELRIYARAVLAGFKIPERWEFRSELPRNAAGKVLHRVLIEESLNSASKNSVSANPRIAT